MLPGSSSDPPAAQGHLRRPELPTLECEHLQEEGPCISWAAADQQVDLGAIFGSVLNPEPTLEFETPPPPDRENCTAELLLQFGAYCCGPGPAVRSIKRRRIAKKSAVYWPYLLQLRNKSENTLQPPPSSWQERRQAANYMRSVYSKAYGLRIRDSHPASAKLWAAASEECKAKWVFLWRVHSAGPDACAADLSGPEIAKNMEKADQVIEVPGLLMTFHTDIGLDDPAFGTLVDDAGLTGDALRDAAVKLPSMKKHFQDFVATIRAFADDIGFKHVACCMEMGYAGSRIGRVHLHAFLCVSAFGMSQSSEGPGRRKVRLDSLHWRAQRPHIQPLHRRGRQKLNAIAASGLYYVLAPKVGSMFTFCSHKIHHDSRVCCGVSADFPFPCCVHSLRRGM